MSEENASLESWDDFVGNSFLKAEQVKGEDHAFVVLDVGLSTNKRKDKDTGDEYEVTSPKLTLQSADIKANFELNKTNAKKLQELSIKNPELGIKSPRSLIGCKLFFKKALVRNPQSNKEVESLRVYKVEK